MAVKLATKASAAGNGAQAVTGACIAVGTPSVPGHGECRLLVPVSTMTHAAMIWLMPAANACRELETRSESHTHASVHAAVRQW